MRERVAARVAAGVVLTLLAACGSSESTEAPTFSYGQSAQVNVPTPGGLVPMRATVRQVLKVSPTAIEMGGVRADLGDAEPYYVRVSYENVNGVGFATPVDGQFRPRQSDGEYAERVTFVSDINDEPFEPCQNPTPPDSFNLRGAALDACLLVLTDPGTTITSVEWTFTDRVTEAIWRPTVPGEPR